MTYPPATMRALRLTDEGLRFDAAYPTPVPAAGEALIRVRTAGVCATDLELMAGYKHGYRGVLGHEFAGEVVAVGDASASEATDWIGARVVGSINIGCGRCALCARGLGGHCRARQSLGIIGRDGAFADYLALPVVNLHRVPDPLTDERAVFAEPLAAALQILEQVHIRPGDCVYQLGDGRLGLLVAQVLASTRCRLTVVGRHKDKLALLARRGIDTVVSSDKALAALAAAPADVVVEATGSHGGFRDARSLVRPRGTLVLKSTFAGNVPEMDLSSLVVDEIALVGSRCGPFAPAVRMLAHGAVEVDALVQARFPLDQGAQALAHAGERGVLKVLIDCRT